MVEKGNIDGQDGLKQGSSVIKKLEALKYNLKNVEAKPQEKYQIFEDFYHMVRLICDNVPDMIWAKDKDKRYIFTNKAIAKNLLNAKDTQEPLGKTDIYFADRERSLNPDKPDWHTFGEICTDSDNIVLESEKAGRFDEFGNVKGEFLFLDVHKAPFLNEEGEIIGTVGCARDVTHEKTIEKSLKDNEDLFHSLVENMLDMVLILDFNGSILFANNAAFEMMGIDPGTSLKGLNVKDFAVDQSIIDIMTHQKMVKAGQFGFLENYKVKDILGNIKWVEGLGKKIEFKGKEVNLVNLRDISQRKKTEEKLQRREKLLEGIAKMNHILLNTTHLESAINASLAAIGNAINVDRLYIFKNHVDKNSGRLFTSQMYEWTNDQINSQLYNPELIDFPYDNINSEVITKFTQKKHYCGLTRELEPFFRKIMENQNILSFLFYPLFVHDKLWGFIGFDDCKQERIWEEFELIILKNAADSISSALERYQSEKDLKQSKNKYKSLIKAIPDMMLIINQEGTILDYSATYAELMPFNKNQIIGTNISKMGLSHKDLQKLLKTIKITIRADSLETVVYELDVPAGHLYFEARFIRLNEESVLSIIRNVTDRVKAQDAIEESLEEKNILLREIHHRVKNNMQIISSLLNLQMKFKNSKKEIEALKDSQTRIKTMAMVHEKLYQSKSLSNINFQEYLQRLLPDISYSYGNKTQINWDVDVGHVEIDLDIAIPLGLIINEIVTNSFKYAFENRNEGNISIQLILKDDKYRLRVADDGVGIPEEIDFKKTDTLGLQLIENLVNQLDGDIKLERRKGTVYKISFPESIYVKRF